MNIEIGGQTIKLEVTQFNDSAIKLRWDTGPLVNDEVEVGLVATIFGLDGGA